MSKARGVLFVALAAAGLAGAAGSSAGAAPSENSPKFLPAGGVRKILRDPKSQATVKAVVYGSSGEIKDPKLGTPHSGNHFVAIKFGFRNMAAPVYKNQLAKSASITNEKGDDFSALQNGRGLAKIELEKGETAYGRVFFEIADDSKVRSVSFKPFGPGSKTAIFSFRPGSGPKSGSNRLPPGGKGKVLRGGSGQVLRAVFYGVAVRIDERSLDQSPPKGTHYVAVQLGLRNMGKGKYESEPVTSASIENTRGKVSKAVHLEGRDLGTVSLGPGRTAYGRIFFELQDGTKVRSFRFKPFGAAGQAAVFTVGS